MAETEALQTRNVEHLAWIVESRYLNHKSSLIMYGLIDTHKSLFDKQKGLRSSAQILLGVAFSLWRAVFLANIEQERGSMLRDVTRFLGELIDSNMINYSMDRQNKDWTFRYYLSNATYRLETLHSKFKRQGYPFELPGSAVDQTPEDRWKEHETALDAAIGAFGRLLDDAAEKKKDAKPRRSQRRPKVRT